MTGNQRVQKRMISGFYKYTALLVLVLTGSIIFGCNGQTNIVRSPFFTEECKVTKAKFQDVSFGDQKLQVEIKTNGGAVFVGIEQALLKGIGELQIIRNDSLLVQQKWDHEQGFQPISLWHVDRLSKGTYVFRVTMRGLPGPTPNPTLKNARLLAFEYQKPFEVPTTDPN